MASKFKTCSELCAMASLREAHPVNLQNPDNPVSKERQDFQDFMDERDCALSHPARVARRLYETMKDMKSMKALKGGVSWLRGFLLRENGKSLLEKGRCFSLHALHALHGENWLRQWGGGLRRMRESSATPV